MYIDVILFPSYSIVDFIILYDDELFLTFLINLLSSPLPPNVQLSHIGKDDISLKIIQSVTCI